MAPNIVVLAYRVDDGTEDPVLEGEHEGAGEETEDGGGQQAAPPGGGGQAA